MTTIRIQLTKPHTEQRKVLDAATRFNVLQCGRRFGKTTLGKIVACEHALEGHKVGWFAPTYKTMSEQWREISYTLKSITASANKIDQQMRLITGGVIDFWSLDNPDSGRGRDYDVVIIDEASVVRCLEEAWQQTIRPTLTDRRGDAWFLGTPKGRNFFHSLFRKGESGDPGWSSWRLGTIANPYMEPDEIEEARRDLPEHVFEQEYLGIPADDSGNPFGIEAVRACVAPLSTAPPVAFGVDLAKSYDWTVLVGLDASGNVCRYQRWQADWKTTKARILAEVNGWPTLVDSTGVGDPIVEDLNRVRANIQGFQFSSRSKQQLMEGLASAIHTQSVRFPEGEIVNELESFEYEYTKTGVRYNAPQGLHDDCVCALALAVRQVSKPTTFYGVLGGYDDNDEFEVDDQW